MLPAQAGVILEMIQKGIDKCHAPRAGGGDPMHYLLHGMIEICSPRRRG